MADLVQPIKIIGLRERQKELRAVGPEAAKSLRVAMNAAAQLVVDEARPGVPTRSGRAAGSIRVRSTQTTAKVMAGGKRAGYYPWLDFGGKVGPGKSQVRPFRKGGRYLYPAFTARRGAIMTRLDDELRSAVQRAGLEVD